MPVDRRQFLEACSAAGLSGLFPGALYAQVAEEADESPYTRLKEMSGKIKRKGCDQ